MYIKKMLFVNSILPSIVLLIVIANAVIISEAKPTERSPPNNSDVERNEDEMITENETENENEKANISAEILQYRIGYSNKMQSFMNQTVDPCDDFYSYACGNWKNTIKERQTQHKRNYLNDIIYKLADSVEDLLLQAPNENFNYTEELKIALQMYNSCLSADIYPMKKSEDYLNVIRKIGGFPAVDKEKWNPDEFSWFNMSAHLSVYDIDAFVREKIFPQYPFPPYFDVPELGFDYIVHSDNIANSSGRGYMLNEKRMREYLIAYGVSDEESTNVIKDIFSFWHAVLAVMDEFHEDFDKCNELDSPDFELWNDYMAIVWNNIDFNISVDDCPCSYFYIKLNEICNERKEAVANYLAMKFLYRMDPKLKNAAFQKEFCINSIRGSLPYLIDHLYMTSYFSDEIKDELVTIIQEIRKSLRVVLNEASWLDNTTRIEALQKESTIMVRVGSFKAPELKFRLIKEMNILNSVQSYEQNNMQLKKFSAYMRRYIGLHHKVLPNDSKPLELILGMQVNGFYYNHDNSINIMAGILHPPAYHKHWPNSLKFGTIGYLIGHEFTHGFDSVGSNFDSNGNERYWWTDKSKDVFNDRSTCYVNHYSNYKIPQIHRNINGNLTLDENLADSGGIREALMAYRRYIKDLYKETESDHKTFLQEEQMPGINLSPEQLFFVGFGQLWCSAYKEEHFWDELTDEHTVDMYRVLGVLKNYDEFSKVFNCPAGSTMNPIEDKCRLW